MSNPNLPCMPLTSAQPETLPRAPSPEGGPPASFTNEPDPQPQIWIGLPPPATDPVLSKLYTQCRYDNRYVRSTGLCVADVMGPPGTPRSLTREHAGSMKRIVSWTAECVGDKPVIPDSAPSNTNEILVEETFVPVSPHYLSDGTTVFRASGIYTYELLVPLSPTDLFFTALPPNTPTLSGVLQGAPTYGPLDRSPNIIGPAPPPAGAPNLIGEF